VSHKPIAAVLSPSALLAWLKKHYPRGGVEASAPAAGSNTYIQFNNNGSLGADADLTWDGSLLTVVQDPTGLSNDTGAGDVVTFGAGPSGGSTTVGKLYYLDDAGQWEEADADAPATGGSQLLAIALGTTPSTHGMLVRGFFDVYSNLVGTFDQGVPVYVSTTAGNIAIAAASATGDFVRVVGYCTDTANVIYFNPDGTYIEIS